MNAEHWGLTPDQRAEADALKGIADELFDNDPVEYARCLRRTEGAGIHEAAARAHNRFGGGYERIYAALEADA